MTPYQLKGMTFGDATVLSSYALNKYRRNVLKCKCGYVFERNNNKLMHKGSVVKQQVCPACRRKAGRKTLASVYKDSYLWRKWESFMMKAYADIGAGVRQEPGPRIMVETTCRDFFEVFAHIKDLSEDGFTLKLRRAEYTVKPRNLVWTRGRGHDREVRPVELIRGR